MGNEYNFSAFRAVNDKELKILEKEHRDISKGAFEAMPWAIGTSFTEIASNIIKDRNHPWSCPIIYIISRHNTGIGIKNLATKAVEFLTSEQKNNPLDILSVTASMDSGSLVLRSLIRIYKNAPDMTAFFDSIGDSIQKNQTVQETVKGKLILPEDIVKNYTEEEIHTHEINRAKQEKIYAQSSKERPLLNQLDHYEPRVLPNPEDSAELIYDLKTKDMSVNTITPYETFTKVFNQLMIFVSGVEYYHYANVLMGNDDKDSFMLFMEQYVKDEYVEKGILKSEDLPAMMKKVERALFQLYVLQDLIDDPEVTDIKITAPNEIRARVHGKAYLSNIHFVDKNDYERFVNSICIRNRVLQDVPSQTFTDNYDENYILRFSLTSKYVNSVDWPYLHIRKVPRKKMMAPELMAAGMFDEKIRDYLLDVGKRNSVVFAGPPGSGKTYCLNWYLEEAYEQSAEILVIQENDELFAYRKGVMFEHVVNYDRKDAPAVSLERLGQLALVAGANVFVIGEAKGAEICSAITLANSGCRTALTIHSPSSTETVNKMADLAMRGYAGSYDQTKRMLKCFQTIVYLENFKIQEISEIIGYDEEKKDMIYRYIYRREKGK